MWDYKTEDTREVKQMNIGFIAHESKRNYFRTFASHTEEFSANMTYMLRELPVV